MKCFSLAPIALASGLLLALTVQAEEVPELPTPQKEHQWLEQFVGEWVSVAEASFGPDQKAMKCEGTQRTRMLGGFWMIAEGQGEMMGTKIDSLLTLGYDPEKKKYVGTWTDSCNHHMWSYEGTLDAAGITLTLSTEGPNMMAPGKTAKYREVIEVRGKDHYHFSSSIQGEDGQWFTFLNVKYSRKK